MPCQSSFAPIMENASPPQILYALIFQKRRATKIIATRMKRARDKGIVRRVTRSDPDSAAAKDSSDIIFYELLSEAFKRKPVRNKISEKILCVIVLSNSFAPMRRYTARYTSGPTAPTASIMLSEDGWKTSRKMIRRILIGIKGSRVGHSTFAYISFTLVPITRIA